MSLAFVSSPTPASDANSRRSPRSNPAPSGDVRFLPSHEVAEAVTDLVGQRFLVVSVGPGSLRHATLRRTLDDAVEGELAARGALPAATGLDADVATCIRDQVFRTRALGTAGLAIVLPPLAEVADVGGRLSAEDSATLVAWTHATSELPIVLLGTDADRLVEAYAPVPVGHLVAARAARATMTVVAPPKPPVMETSDWLGSAEEPTDPFDMTPTPAATVAPRAAAPIAPPVHIVEPQRAPQPQPIAHHAAASSDAGKRRGILKGLKRTPLTPPGAPIEGPPRTDVNRPIAISDALSRAATPVAPVANLSEIQAENDRFAVTPARDVCREPPPVKRAPLNDASEAAPFAGALRAPSNERSEAAPHAAGLRMPSVESALPRQRPVAERAVNAAEWREMAIDLDNARGPRPARAIEQLFITKYAPLLGAVLRGEADQTVRAVVDAWSDAFERSYVEAFAAMRVTGKRPPMVLDAPEIAARLGRHHGARSVKLLLIDSMGFDLGERVAAELKARASASGVCIERMLLWSALPTTTPTQMHFMGRGNEGLRDNGPVSEQEPDITRGRALSTLRRERVGNRELMKLELVEARLRTPGAAYEERLDGIADEVATVVARYLETLPARTMLFFFGDHGFRMPATPDGRATGSASQGGASPEEVLVPGYAWMAGGVH